MKSEDMLSKRARADDLENELIIQASALLALADQVILKGDDLRMEGEVLIGLSLVIDEARRLIHAVDRSV